MPESTEERAPVRMERDEYVPVPTVFSESGRPHDPLKVRPGTDDEHVTLDGGITQHRIADLERAMEICREANQ